MAAPNLSVLIVSFNCWSYLDKCIHSILASDDPILEIIVVDNASADGTPSKLRAKYPEVHLVENSENLGLPPAANRGFRLAKGDRILLLDADTELKPDAIGIMERFLDEHPDVWMVAPRTFYSDGTIQESARDFPSAINGLFGRQSVLTRLFPNNPFSKRYLAREHLDEEEPFRVQQISAACMLFRKEALDRVGEWDEGFRCYFVDTEWCKRIQEAEGLVYCVPEASIFHHEQNKSSRKKNPRRIVDFHKGAFRLYQKHYTRGMWDPRWVLAASALTLRTTLLLALNAMKSSSESDDDPFSAVHRKEA